MYPLRYTQSNPGPGGFATMCHGDILTPSPNKVVTISTQTIKRYTTPIPLHSYKTESPQAAYRDWEISDGRPTMNRFHILAPAAALLVLVPACDDDDDEPTDVATNFTASLSGANEVPPVPSTATGTATLEIVGDEIEYTINVTDLQNAVVAHIHIAPEGENGPVRLNLCGTGAPEPPCVSGTGVLATGSNGTTVGTPAITFDELVSAMRSGNAYVNVHTDDGEGEQNTGPGDMASGEIRGQVVAE